MDRQPRYSSEEFARRGEAAYQEKVHPLLHAADDGKTVAIDIETGEWELDGDEMAACDRLLERLPTAQVWIVRAGGLPIRHFGRGRRVNPRL